MARAKRTDRAEARRRYRAYLASIEEPETSAEDAEAEAPAAGRWRFPGNRSAISAEDAAPHSTAIRANVIPDDLPKTKVGIGQAIRMAYKPVHYREDLRLLPYLMTRTHATWPIALLAIYGVVALAFLSKDSEDLWFVTGSFAVTPYPLLPAMLAGFLTPRASWLMGIVAGVISCGTYIGLVLVHFSDMVKNNAALKDVSGTQLTLLCLEMLFYAISFGALMGAFTGWYKRFLMLSSGPRQQRSRPAGKSSKQTGRRGGGR